MQFMSLYPNWQGVCGRRELGSAHTDGHCLPAWETKRLGKVTCSNFSDSTQIWKRLLHCYNCWHEKLWINVLSSFFGLLVGKSQKMRSWLQENIQQLRKSLILCFSWCGSTNDCVVDTTNPQTGGLALGNGRLSGLSCEHTTWPGL